MGFVKIIADLRHVNHLTVIKLRSFKLTIYILCTVLFCPLAFAEVQDEVDRGVPARQLEIDKAVKDASREALIQKDLERDEIVTYEQILTNPSPHSDEPTQ